MVDKLNIADEIGGNEVGDQVSLSDILSQTAVNVGGNQEPIQPSFGAKGLGGSGFDMLGGLLLSGVNNSALTTAVVKNIKEVFTKYELESKGFSIIPLDREAITSLAYSCVVITKPYKGKNDAKTYAPYYILVLEGTGNKNMTAGQIKNEIDSAIKLNKKPNIWMADLAVDKYLLNIVRDAIKGKLGSDVIPYSLDGLVVPAHHSATLEVLCEKLAIAATDTIIANEVIVTSARKDINLATAIADNSSIKAEITLNTNGIAYHNLLDKPISADAIVELVEVKNQNQTLQTLNVPDSRFKLGQVAVKLEFVPEQIQKPVPGGSITAMRLRPHVVITNVECHPTTGFLMLMIRAGALITQQNTWVALAANNKHLGALNILTNLEGDPSGYGQPYDFTRKDLTPDAIQDIVRKMCEGLDPIISIDIDKFGPTTSLGTILTQAANGESPAAKTSALGSLVKAISGLTNGLFANFDPNNIFSAVASVPSGTYGSKAGERDIRDLDNAFIAATTKDIVKITKATFCKIPKAHSGTDPMTASVEFIASVVDEAEIAGRTYRLTFNGGFIAELINKTSAVGLNLAFEPLIRQSNNLSLDMMNNVYGNASVRGDMGGIAMNVGGMTNNYAIYDYSRMGRY